MLDSDPRPMPPQVLAAYQDPLDLAGLLASSVFTDKERFAVRDELLERLIAKHGSVDVEIGLGSKTLPIRKRIAQFKKNVWRSIELLLSVEEYGGRDGLRLELAKAMQPYWANWWESMTWEDGANVRDSVMVSSIVLGRRQMVWLAAQCVRSVVDFTRASDRQVCVDAIEAAEAWAIVPSEINRKRAATAYNAAYYAADDAAYDAAAYVLFAAAYAAAASFDPYYVTCVADAISNVAYTVNADAQRKAAERLCDLVRRLIAPTLITSASRGLR